MMTLLVLPQDTTNPVAEAPGRVSRSPRRMKCRLSKGLESVTFNPIEFEGFRNRAGLNASGALRQLEPPKGGKA